MIVRRITILAPKFCGTVVTDVAHTYPFGIDVDFDTIYHSLV